MRVSRLLAGIAALMLWMVPVWALAAQAAPPEQAMLAFGVQLPKVRKPAPDFSLPGLDGGQVRLSDFRGQLVLLHFWATWCVPCRHEMPLLHSLENSLKEKRFRIVCVNVDRGDRQRVRSFMDEVSPRFHTLLDPQGGVRNRYEVRALPTSYLIAADGRLIGRIIGEREWDSPGTVALFQKLADAYAEAPDTGNEENGR